MILSGQAYPGSTVEVLRKSEVEEHYSHVPISESSIEEDGTFSITYKALLQGIYFFALIVEDKDERETGIISFSANLIIKDRLIAKDIFVPPTVGFKNAGVKKGDGLEIVGYSAPTSTIELTIDGIVQGETISDASGYYTYSTSTALLDFGQHHVKTRQTNSSGKMSNFSFARSFKVSKLETPKADFNNDEEINITDWSIFLFRWGSEDESLKYKIDLDESGTVDIADFSIFLKNMKTS